jgi:adenine-specific DNA-methyltransferase
VFGDNLPVMRSLLEDDNIAGQVRLIYIDPPYSTGFTFESSHVGKAYEDWLSGADYLEGLRQRLILLRELLAQDGSIYVHLDRNMVFPAKLIMDELFGEKNFHNLISRVKCNPKNYTSRQFGDECDYLLFYTKSRNYVWNHPVEPWPEAEGLREYPYIEDGTGRRFKKVPCHLPGVRNGATGGEWRGRKPPPGKHWVNSPDRLEELDRQGRIYWSSSGNPRRKLYLDEALGRRLPNFWYEFRDTQNQNARVTGFPTEKNREMMGLIVQASSEPDDLVLDAYAGSGTTLEAAGICGRAWIGVDNSLPAVKTALRRLRRGAGRMGSYAQANYLIGHAETEGWQLAGALLVDSSDSSYADCIAELLDEQVVERAEADD